MECYVNLREKGTAINIHLSETWWRHYQVRELVCVAANELSCKKNRRKSVTTEQDCSSLSSRMHQGIRSLLSTYSEPQWDKMLFYPTITSAHRN